jgi:hypothetical protein
MSMRALCLAGALTMGLGSAAMAQSIGVHTPFGGVGVYGPDRYAYSYDAYRYGPRGYHRGPAVGVGIGPVGVGVGSYGYGYSDAYAYDDAYAYEPRGNLGMANPHANPDVNSGWSTPAQDRYMNELGIVEN